MLTRRDRYGDAVAGARAAARAGLLPVKVNAVLMPGVNDRQAPDLLLQSLLAGYRLRFIERMPLGPPGTWRAQDVVTADEILGMLRRHFDLALRPAEERGASPAQEWDVAPCRALGVEHPGGSVGVIASVTRPFCGDCDRTRLTSDGMVRSCLFSTEETSLRDLLRGGGDDAQIAARWADAMWAKPAAHGLNLDAFARPSRTMSRIGG